MTCTVTAGALSDGKVHNSELDRSAGTGDEDDNVSVAKLAMAFLKKPERKWMLKAIVQRTWQGEQSPKAVEDEVDGIVPRPNKTAFSNKLCLLGMFQALLGLGVLLCLMRSPLALTQDRCGVYMYQTQVQTVWWVVPQASSSKFAGWASVKSALPQVDPATPNLRLLTVINKTANFPITGIDPDLITYLISSRRYDKHNLLATSPANRYCADRCYQTLASTDCGSQGPLTTACLSSQIGGVLQATCIPSTGVPPISKKPGLELSSHEQYLQAQVRVGSNISKAPADCCLGNHQDPQKMLTSLKIPIEDEDLTTKLGEVICPFDSAQKEAHGYFIPINPLSS
ncbi:hypothetical protein QBC40DRAFT_292284 [Triangularia verruculosa]|uniref:Uncharacterized protein n=1 Tax=Triangularia verruculosa TaxID=2587418 RepID=A0AAN6XR97_9PEZI|nr:hypothetical protein QBC40DRAFT_292284 [Triangularia verruculosa]